MNYIILDLEATCWKERSLKRRNEIIEIGALKINESGETLDEFCRFVRPLTQPILSDFCTELTSITQEQVDSAELFPTVIQEFWDWIDISQPYLLGSWGMYDRNQFREDCALHGLESGWLESHISLKHQYTKIKNLRRNVGMKTALSIENFELEGTHHRGIDDARNIAKIFVRHMDQWKQ